MKGRREIFIQPELCTGCHSCELACALSHTPSKELAGALLRGERTRALLWVEQVGRLKAPVVCRQCEDAPCVQACPTGAMHTREDGINLVDVQECIACWMCAMACPFGTIGRGEHKVVKCDRACLDEEGTPACVRACPTGALAFQTVEDFQAARRRTTATAAAVPA